MTRPPTESIRLLRVASAGEGALARALAEPGWERDAQVLKENEEGSVVAATLAGRAVVIKTMPLRTPADRIRSVANRSRLARQWRGALVLRKAGVRTAEPLALLQGVGGRGERVESLILERLEGRTLLEHLRDRDLTFDEAAQLVESMAGDLERMFFTAFNRDHKPSNLVVVRERGALRAVVIDTVGVRRLRGLSGASNTRLARMLANLVIEPMGVGCAPSVYWRHRLICRVCDYPRPKAQAKPGWSKPRARMFARRLMAMADELVRGHGDPTPKDNPFEMPRPVR